MSEYCQTFDKSVCIGGWLGGLTGLVVGLWVAIKFIQPAIDDIDGLSENQVAGITAAIALFGELEAFVAAGIVSGMFAGPILTGVGACAYGVASAAVNICSTATSFFGKKNNQPQVIELDQIDIKSNIQLI